MCAVGPRLVGGEKAQAFALAKGVPGVRIKAVKDNGAVLAVFVNSAPTMQEAKLVWQAADGGGVLTFEGGKQIEISNGTATIPLQPFGVEIIRWTGPK